MAFRFGPFSFRRVYKMFSRQMTGFRAIVAAAPIFAGIAAHHQLQLQLTVCDSTSKVRKMKKTVSERAVDEFVHDHYVVGLGTGSTCYYAVLHLAELLRVGALQHVSVIPCSESLRALCVSVGIPVTSLNDTDRVDVIIDGADEVDVSLSMLKGGSGAFLREKMVQNAVGKRVIVVDDSKLVKSLGPGKPLPVEVRQTCPFRDDPACLNAHCRKCDQVTPFSAEHTRRTLEHLPELAGCRALIRRGNLNTSVSDGFEPAVTDNGNYVVDLFFAAPIKDVAAAAKALDAFPGVVAHGLFCNAGDDAHTTVIVAGDRGIRVAGEGGEKCWWTELPTGLPIDRIAVDNRRPDADKDVAQSPGMP